MTYDKENDFFIYAYGRKLVPVGSRVRKSKSNYASKVTIYECLDC